MLSKLHTNYHGITTSESPQNNLITNYCIDDGTTGKSLLFDFIEARLKNTVFL